MLEGPFGSWLLDNLAIGSAACKPYRHCTHTLTSHWSWINFPNSKLKQLKHRLFLNVTTTFRKSGTIVCRRDSVSSLHNTGISRLMGTNGNYQTTMDSSNCYHFASQTSWSLIFAFSVLCSEVTIRRKTVLENLVAHWPLNCGKKIWIWYDMKT